MDHFLGQRTNGPHELLQDQILAEGGPFGKKYMTCQPEDDIHV
jgi:hypothetical protein